MTVTAPQTAAATKVYATAGNLIAEWHSLAPCGVDGWVASVVDIDRPYSCLAVDDLDGATEEQAREWALSELRKRTGVEPTVVNLVARNTADAIAELQRKKAVAA